jgi:hypothetical protein
MFPFKRDPEPAGTSSSRELESKAKPEDVKHTYTTTSEAYTHNKITKDHLLKNPYIKEEDKGEVYTASLNVPGGWTIQPKTLVESDLKSHFDDAFETVVSAKEERERLPILIAGVSEWETIESALFGLSGKTDAHNGGEDGVDEDGMEEDASPSAATVVENDRLKGSEDA